MANALSYLWGTVTQGSADAFAQAEIATGLYNVSKIAYRIRELLFEFTSNSGIVVVAAANIEVALTRNSKSAMPQITDKALIHKMKRISKFVTSGGSVVPGVFREPYTEDDNLLIVEDPLYLQIDSDTTSVANVCNLRIGYERVSITDVDRLTLIANSLSA